MTCLTMEMGGSSAAVAKATKHRMITWFQFIEQLSSPNWHIFSPAQQWLQVEMYPQILNCYDSLTNFIFVLECSFQSLGVEWWWTSLPVSLYTCRWLITKCVSLKIKNCQLSTFQLTILLIFCESCSKERDGELIADLGTGRGKPCTLPFTAARFAQLP